MNPFQRRAPIKHTRTPSGTVHSMAYGDTAALTALSFLWNLLLFLLYIVGFLLVLAYSSVRASAVRSFQILSGLLTKLNDFFLATFDLFDGFFDIPFGVGTVLSFIIGYPLRLFKLFMRGVPGAPLLLGFIALLGITTLGMSLSLNQTQVMVGLDDAWCSTRDGADLILGLTSKFQEALERFGMHIINALLFLNPQILLFRLIIFTLSVPQNINDGQLLAIIESNERFMAFAAFLFEGAGYLSDFFIKIPHNRENCYSLADEPEGGECSLTENSFNVGEDCGDDDDCEGTCVGGSDVGQPCDDGLFDCPDSCVGGSNPGNSCPLGNIQCFGGGTCTNLGSCEGFVAATCVLLPPVTVTVPLTCKLSESPDNRDCLFYPADCPALQEGECFSGANATEPCSLDSDCANECAGGDFAGRPCSPLTTGLPDDDCPGSVCTVGQCSVAHMCPDDLLICWLSRIFNVFLVPICNFARSLVEENDLFAFIFKAINQTTPQLVCIFLQFLFEVLFQAILDFTFLIIRLIQIAVNSSACFTKKVACFAVCTAPCSGFATFNCGAPTNCGASLGCPSTCEGPGDVFVPIFDPLTPTPVAEYPDGACDVFSTNPGENCASSSECGAGTCRTGSCEEGPNQGFGCAPGSEALHCGSASITCNTRKCKTGTTATKNRGCSVDSDCFPDDVCDGGIRNGLQCTNLPCIGGTCGGTCVDGRPCRDTTFGLLNSCPAHRDDSALRPPVPDQRRTPIMTRDYSLRRPITSSDEELALFRRWSARSTDPYSLDTVGEQVVTGRIDPTFPDSACYALLKAGNPQAYDDGEVPSPEENEYKRCVSIYASYIAFKGRTEHPSDMAADELPSNDALDLLSPLLDELVMQNVSLPSEDPCKYVLDHPMEIGDMFPAARHTRCMALYTGSYYLSQRMGGFISPQFLTYLDYDNTYASQVFDYIFTVVGWHNDTMVAGVNGGELYDFLLHGWDWTMDTDIPSVAADLHTPEGVEAAVAGARGVRESVLGARRPAFWEPEGHPYPGYVPEPTPTTVTLGARMPAGTNATRTTNAFDPFRDFIEMTVDWLCDNLFSQICTSPIDLDEVIEDISQFIATLPKKLLPRGGWRIPECDYNPLTARKGKWTWPGCALRLYLPWDFPDAPQTINAELIPWPLDCVDGTTGCAGNQCSTVSQLCNGGPDVGLVCFTNGDCEGFANLCVRTGTCSDSNGLEFFDNCGSSLDCSECAAVCLGGGNAGAPCVRNANCDSNDCAMKVCAGGTQDGTECFTDLGCPNTCVGGTQNGNICSGIPGLCELGGGTCNVGTCENAGTCFSDGSECSNDLECDSGVATCAAYEECSLDEIGFTDGFDHVVWTIEALCPACMAVLRADPFIRSLPFGIGDFAAELLARFEGTHTTDPKTLFCYWFTWAYIVLPTFIVAAFYTVYLVIAATLLLNILLGLWLLIGALRRIPIFFRFVWRQLQRERINNLEEIQDRARDDLAEMRRLLLGRPPAPSAPPAGVGATVEERQPLLERTTDDGQYVKDKDR